MCLDDDLGQRIVAFVVGDADPNALIEFVAQELSVHKRPREVRIVDSLPRNALGKVLKKELAGWPEGGGGGGGEGGRRTSEIR